MTYFPLELMPEDRQAWEAAWKKLLGLISLEVGKRGMVGEHWGG
jgi:hypothetical protein